MKQLGLELTIRRHLSSENRIGVEILLTVSGRSFIQTEKERAQELILEDHL
jgi:hypothetical protein